MQRRIPSPSTLKSFPNWSLRVDGLSVFIGAIGLSWFSESSRRISYAGPPSVHHATVFLVEHSSLHTFEVLHDVAVGYIEFLHLAFSLLPEAVAT